MLWILLGILAGLVLPIQTLVNTRLRASTGTPFSSSMISFAVGTVTLLIVATAITGGDYGIAQAFDEPLWIWFGGLLGVVALTGNILLFPHLGAVQTVVLPIAGQVIMGLIVDHFGLFESPQSSLTAVRAIGAIIVLVGVIAVVATPSAATSSEDSATALWLWRLAGFIFGCFTASQSAINGHLGQVTGSPVSAALVSFAVGVTALVIVNIVLRWRPRIERPEGKPNPWWMWIGGVLGALFIFGNAALVPQIGTGLTVVAGLLGSMLGSLIIDRVSGAPIKSRQVLGIALLLTGVVLIRLV
ncbi:MULTISPECIES: DMT family transporter [Corynebacterium]|uniref:DMT family transporter n=1 Tax=Corynebacterium TaxID=1716 RepID=UPI001EF55F68|nr:MULTISPECIES: DMT family transporter [Corynebacterium]MCG7234651.1 DMT family transporter [Corynebacterium sp. ACRPR]MCG7243804.1 DMT family transporter [Corynebacterium sp. ACRPS]MCG7272446.1 DMT family transporter [Corynebacterium sp. ACRQM]MDK8474109.1 DMT family transporter [Corynebacterium sp. MSK078]MDK8658274.1 DMT family transporter [Corynebacterium sp. MSK204]